MKIVKFIICFLVSFSFFSLAAQDVQLKKETTESELAYIQSIFENISISDQKYRSYLMYETLDDQIIAKTDSLMNNVGIKEGMSYVQSLDLSLPQKTKDSLNRLQNQIDLQNHMILRGIWDTYGYIPESIIKEKNYVQHLLLLHPPSEWDVLNYQQSYAKRLLEEVKARRMPAKSYASFYDNMLSKILKKPQLYGTGMYFDSETGKILPPIIESLSMANEARAAIGMPDLKDGEYRLENSK